MLLKYFIPCALLSGMLTAQSPSSSSNSPRSNSPRSNSQSESRQAVSLLRGITADVEHIRASAMDLEKLTRNRDVKWLQYDRQWNEIKPAQEALDLKLQRLESMEAALTPPERKAVDASKVSIQKITSETHELRALLDQPQVDLKSPMFKRYAQSLVHQAGEAIRDANTGIPSHSAKLVDGSRHSS